VAQRGRTASGKVLNCSTSSAGSIRVELQDADGKALPGRDLPSCKKIYGDDLERTVVWADGSDVGKWSTKPTRLRFALRDADLYSCHFRNP
jgi:hypothetical protein